MKTLHFKRNDILLFNIIVSAIGLAIFLICMPKYGDDLWFAAGLRDWMGGGGSEQFDSGGNIFNNFPWQQIKHNMKWHFLYDNARLCNALVICMPLLPKWMGSTIVFSLFCFGVNTSFRYCGIRPTVSVISVIAIFLLSFCLPWGDKIGSLVFQFNYPLSTGLFMLLLSFVWKKHNRPRTWIWMIPIGILAGIWHEGFSVPMFCGLFTLSLIDKRWRTPALYCLLSSMALGILWLTITTSATFSATPNPLSKGILHNCLLFPIMHEINYLTIPLFIILLCTKRGRREAKSDRFIFLAVSAAISFMMAVVLRPIERTAWWYDYASIMLAMIMLRSLCGGYLHKITLNNAIIWLPLTLLTIVHWIITDYYVFKFRDTYRSVITTHLANPYETVYIDWPSNSEYPIICGSQPQRGVELYPYYLFENYYTPKSESEKIIKCVPSALRHITGQEGEIVEGIDSLRIYHGHLYIPKNAIDFDKYRNEFTEGKNSYVCNCDFGYGEEKCVIVPQKFRSAADGKEYYYLFLESNLTNRIPFNLKRISLDEDFLISHNLLVE